MDIIENLRIQGVRESLIKDILHFRKEYKVDNEVKHRVTKSPAFYIGKDILSMCISAILEEENILLSGPKAREKTCFQIIYRKYLEDHNGTHPFI